MCKNIIKFSEAEVQDEIQSKLGDTSVTVYKYYSSDTVQSGIWECKKGTFTIEAHIANEMCHILEGQGVITYPDGTQLCFEGGDTLYIPKGTNMKWDVLEDIRKVYMVAP